MPDQPIDPEIRRAATLPAAFYRDPDLFARSRDAHAGLTGALDYDQYRTELFASGTLQVGIASRDEEPFELPASSPDYGQRIAAYYVWLFPNLMLNVYPWGISVNIVRPLAADRTRVSFLSYVWDPSRLDRGAGSALDRVEREDEVVVEGVQRGIRSRLYSRGRFSPVHETGVHHFHRLLAERLAGGDSTTAKTSSRGHNDERGW